MLGSGALLALFGLLPVVSLPVSVPVNLLLGVGWLVFSTVELGRILAGFRRVAGLRLDDSLLLELKSPAGEWRPGRFAAGTLVLGRAVWLRFRDIEGRLQGELLTGDPRYDAGFRRLVVLLEYGQEARKH